MKRTALILLFLSLSIILLCPFTEVSASMAPYLIDDADLLTPEEEASLYSRIYALREEYDTEVIIVTVTNTGGYTPRSFAENYYEQHGCGIGEDQSGILLLIVTGSERAWEILTCGSGKKAFGREAIDQFEEEALYDLQRGDYAAAFSTYVSLCGSYMAKTQQFPWLSYLAIALAGGFIAALISVSVMKGKLRSVRAKQSADGYVQQGSLNLRRQRDVFLYVTQSRTSRPKNNSSGHSSGNRSSGGRYGGRGGRF